MPAKDAAALCAQLVERWIGYFQAIGQSYTVPARIDLDDCVQECLIELSTLVNELDPTDPEFSSILKRRVFCRLVELCRGESCAKRDVNRTVPLDDDGYDALCDADPATVAEVREVEEVIASRLTPQQRLVWRELVQPGRRLGDRFTEYRRERGLDVNDVPVDVYAEVTGLSYRQVRYALDRIRSVARSVLTEGGTLCLS